MWLEYCIQTGAQYLIVSYSQHVGRWWREGFVGDGWGVAGVSEYSYPAIHK